jgi:hypothetical protein
MIETEKCLEREEVQHTILARGAMDVFPDTHLATRRREVLVGLSTCNGIAATRGVS